MHNQTEPEAGQGRADVGTLGFIGCGTLTEAVVRAIRRNGGGPPILLSPRSESLSVRLAAELPGITRAASNADVIAGSQTVVLAMRPQQIDQALDGLRFSAGQTIVSFVAKLSIDELRRRVAPAREVCRVIPLTMIADGKGPIVVFPRVDAVARLFDGCGLVIEPETEEQVMAFGCASAVMSTYFQFQNTVVDWLEARGVDPAAASGYVASMLDGLAATGMANQGAARLALPELHETKGGLNEHCRRDLAASGWFAAITAALDALDRKVSLLPEAKSPDASRP
ncbi:NAD(P)-binding domain-containing protein [Xanthobacteraceae bacterium Astr-EGSB]|uniref:NAD(P)-binding domain-containing protein n=1 Tax=Astrobacterium formosum TaxID=3069710 RepID=UPI0027AF4520|nr:NAD(P)-binding domain-containing protein [Xanthobacteraceae bacterium Astr-EGSB]